LAKRLDDDALRNVFAKIDSNILNEGDRDSVYEVVNKIKKQQDLSSNERYVAHYVSYLIDIADRISQHEDSVRQFIDICNSYLYGKEFHFDNIEYSVEIVDKRMRDDSSIDASNLIEMEDLSSGEKQIVSLFSHLMLGGDGEKYVFIDEPELSLSVDWQQRFLADISAASGCVFIGAVTHSPFIFDNSLDKYAVDILKHSSI
jgi:predicted ATPase